MAHLLSMIYNNRDPVPGANQSTHAAIPCHSAHKLLFPQSSTREMIRRRIGGVRLRYGLSPTLCLFAKLSVYFRPSGVRFSHRSALMRLVALQPHRLLPIPRKIVSLLIIVCASVQVLLILERLVYLPKLIAIARPAPTYPK